MPKQYASQQPAGYVNYVRNIAIVGAGGQVGSYLTEGLLKTTKHTLTALTRANSKSTFPSSVLKKEVNYDDELSLTDALRGQDALIITMATTAPQDTSARLIRAAAAAKVPWVLPNEWGLDHANESLANETIIGAPIIANRKLVTELEVSSYIAFINSFWYEYSLPFGECTFGFDIPNKTVTFFDQGKQKINTSSFPQCGKGVAGLLSLKVLPDDENDKSACLDQFRNQSVYVASFALNQEEMLDSILRVTGDQKSDWTINYENSKERWERSCKEFDGGKGPRFAFARAMYTRVFYPDGAGHYSASKGLHNDLLGIQEEDPDFYTKLALERKPTQPA